LRLGRSLILTIAFTAAMLVLISCASNPEKKADDSREGDLHYQIGVTYLAKGNVEMANFELSKAVRLMPADPKVRFAMGTVFLYKGQTDRAIVEFIEVIKLDPHHADAYNNLGAAYVRLEKWDMAIQACSKALDQIGYQTPEKALTIIGWYYFKKGDSTQALNYLKRALDIKADSPDTSNKISEVYLTEGNLEKAQRTLSELVRRYPKFIGARLNLGITYYKLRDLTGARKEFNAVLRLADRTSEVAGLARGYLDLIE